MKEKLPEINCRLITNFNDLHAIELYDILKLRQDVFIIEQQCIYSDIDDLDIYSEHLLMYQGSVLAAYCRFVPAGKKLDELSIGRVVVSQRFRRKNIGKELMRTALRVLAQKEVHIIKIEAQNYLRSFYESFGFTIIDGPYDIDGIPHILMETNIR